MSNKESVIIIQVPNGPCIKLGPVVNHHGNQVFGLPERRADGSIALGPNGMPKQAWSTKVDGSLFPQGLPASVLVEGELLPLKAGTRKDGQPLATGNTTHAGLSVRVSFSESVDGSVNIRTSAAKPSANTFVHQDNNIA